MKTLIVEDDFTCRFLLSKLLDSYGQSHIAINGKEAVAAVRDAWDCGEPYDLICMDIMMPEMDGQMALQQIRQLEEDRGIQPSKGAKIIMTTAMGDMKNVSNAFHSLCDAYLTKPIIKGKLMETLQSLKLISPATV
jgi:two-component system chemotaxis response regulator CheY